MAGSIEVRWPGGARTFEPGTVVRLGREAGNDVVVANDNVSRRHAELVDTPSGWVLRDLGSAQGTWIDGRKAATVPVAGSTSVSLGQPPKGTTVELVVAAGPGDVPGAGPALPGTVLPGGALPGTVLPGGAALPPPPAGAPSPPPPGGDGTVLVGGSPDRPGGRLREEAVAGATVVTGEVLNLECAGRSYAFDPGQVVTIGRDEACTVTSANPTVSRNHAAIRHDGSSWVLEDTGSAGGTYLDGGRVRTLRLSGSTAVWLGSPDSGERVVAVTSGPTRPTRRGRRGPWSIVAAAVVVVAVLVAGVVVVRRSDSASASAPDALVRATVSIQTTNVAPVAGGTCTYHLQGSGSLVDRDEGLILTNAHVVKPEAPGLDLPADEACDRKVERPDPEEILVSIAPGPDLPAEPMYKAEVATFDGALDLAVIRITETLGGRIVGRGDLAGLTEVALADSDDVTTGDRVRVFGFPVAAQSQGVSLSDGVISGIVGDEDLGTNRAWFNTDAEISGGNSGGLAADDRGRLVGVPSILRAGKVGSLRPVDLARPLIEAAQDGGTYESPYT